MKALIVEDEPMAQAQLARMLDSQFEDIEIVGRTDSVRGCVEFLRGNTPDVIFMDVELSDGVCFEIFKQVDVRSKVIMTTAYDSYAIKAFEAGSIDYLLKPIEVAALNRAVSRCQDRTFASSDGERLLAAMGHAPAYRKRVVVRVGCNIIPVECSNIAYFMSEGKGNSLVTCQGKKYVIDSTLDTIEREVDPSVFFRISRSFIVSRGSVENISRHINGRLRLSLKPTPSEPEILVSRARVDDFLTWIG